MELSMRQNIFCKIDQIQVVWEMRIFYYCMACLRATSKQGPLFCALGPSFCARVREEAILAVGKRCANEGFACMCKELVYFDTRGQNGRLAHCIFTRAVSESPVWPHVSNHIFLYKFMQTRVGSPFTDIESAPRLNFTRQLSTRRY